MIRRKSPQLVQLNNERVQYWLSKGAQPSDTVRSLLRTAQSRRYATLSLRLASYHSGNYVHSSCTSSSEFLRWARQAVGETP